jgi:hypothetical protein
MTAAIGLAAVAIFAFVLRLLGIARLAQTALDGSRTAAQVLMDRGRSEGEKEQAARSAGIHLLRCSLRIAGGLCLAAAPAAALIAVAAAGGLTSMGQVAASLSSPWMLVGAIAVSLPAFVAR